MSQGKLSFLIAAAFSNTDGENWNVCGALPSGMNWAVRFMNGAREICYWRDFKTQASEVECNTMAKHAGFAAWDCTPKSNAAGVTSMIVREKPAPAIAVDLEQAEFEALDVETPNRSDHRPGLPLESPRRIKPNQVYHFTAFGVLWVVKLEPIRDGERFDWAAQEPLEGPDGGYQTGTLTQFEAWFKKHGQLSPLEPPERWRA
jgi:hypothetical protein